MSDLLRNRLLDEFYTRWEAAKGTPGRARGVILTVTADEEDQLLSELHPAECFSNEAGEYFLPIPSEHVTRWPLVRVRR